MTIRIERQNNMIYNVYHKGSTNMKEITVSKWGNSLGFRIPNSVVKQFKLKEGDILTLKESENSFNVSKKNTNSVESILCDFYGKNINEILEMKIVDSNKELDWGEDVGAEVIK